MKREIFFFSFRDKNDISKLACPTSPDTNQTNKSVLKITLLFLSW